jgi:acetyl esterase/lipase
MRFFFFVMALLIALPAQANTKIFSDIAYGNQRLQKLDVYQPDSCRQANCPVVIWVHGGGWRNGHKSQRSTPDMLKAWASQGIVMVSINYRLTPDVTHPAHVQDVAAAVHWVSQTISRYGADPKRISLLGHSAGAHLVALAGTSPVYLAAHGLSPASLRHVFPIDTASFDLAENNTRMVKRMIENAFGSDPAGLREASPIWNVTNGRAYPNFIIAAAGSRTDAVATSNQLAAKLRQSGGKAEVLVMNYDPRGQLKAHADIARDLANLDSTMTRKMIAAVLTN